MSNFLTTLVGICVAVAGGILGFRRTLYIIVAFLAVFASVSLNRAFFAQLSEQFGTITSPQNASVISFLILTLVPSIAIAYTGRSLINRFQVDEESLPRALDAVLGSGCAVGIYAGVLCII